MGAESIRDGVALLAIVELKDHATPGESISAKGVTHGGHQSRPARLGSEIYNGHAEPALPALEVADGPARRNHGRLGSECDCDSVEIDAPRRQSEPSPGQPVHGSKHRDRATQRP